MRHDETEGTVGPDSDANAPGASGDSEASEHPELDPDEGADAFETLEDSREGERRSGAEREDADHISMDTPD